VAALADRACVSANSAFSDRILSAAANRCDLKVTAAAGEGRRALLSTTSFLFSTKEHLS